MIAAIIFNKSEPRGSNAVVAYTEGGVGYKVFTPDIKKIPVEGVLHIHHHITDRGQALYGFTDYTDVKLFQDLISVDKIGPVVALKLMSDYEADKIRIDIADGDTVDLAKAKGVGPKTAEAIVHKLKKTYADFATKKKAPDIKVISDDRDEITSKFSTYIEMATKALVKLGFKKTDAEQKVSAIGKELFINILNTSTQDNYIDTTSFEGDKLVSRLITEALK